MLTSRVLIIYLQLRISRGVGALPRRRILSCPTTVCSAPPPTPPLSATSAYIVRARGRDPDCSGGLAPAPRVHHRQRRGELAAPDSALRSSSRVRATPSRSLHLSPSFFFFPSASGKTYALPRLSPLFVFLSPSLRRRHRRSPSRSPARRSPRLTSKNIAILSPLSINLTICQIHNKR